MSQCKVDKVSFTSSWSSIGILLKILDPNWSICCSILNCNFSPLTVNKIIKDLPSFGFLIFRTVYNEALFGVSFALCAGIMIYVSLNELLPVAKEYGKPSDPIIGVTAGIIVMAISLILMYA